MNNLAEYTLRYGGANYLVSSNGDISSFVARREDSGVEVQDSDSLYQLYIGFLNYDLVARLALPIGRSPISASDDAIRTQLIALQQQQNYKDVYNSIIQTNQLLALVEQGVDAIQSGSVIGAAETTAEAVASTLEFQGEVGADHFILGLVDATATLTLRKSSEIQVAARGLVSNAPPTLGELDSLAEAITNFQSLQLNLQAIASLLLEDTQPWWNAFVSVFKPWAEGLLPGLEDTAKTGNAQYVALAPVNTGLESVGRSVDVQEATDIFNNIFRNLEDNIQNRFSEASRDDIRSYFASSGGNDPGNSGMPGGQPATYALSVLYPSGGTFVTEPLTGSQEIVVQIDRSGSNLTSETLFLSTLQGLPTSQFAAASAASGDYLPLYFDEATGVDTEQRVVFSGASTTAYSTFTLLADSNDSEGPETFKLMLRDDQKDLSAGALATTDVFVYEPSRVSQPTSPPDTGGGNDRVPSSNGSSGDPDYAYTYLNINKGSVQYDEEFNITFGAINNGGDAGRQSETAFVLSTDQRYGDSDDRYIRYNGLKALDAGEVDSSESTNIRLSDYFSPDELENDDYYIFVMLDYEEDLREQNYSDNLSNPLKISLSGVPGEPDLVIRNLSLAASSVLAGEQFDFSYDVVNTGSGQNGQYQLNHYLSSDSTFSSDDELLFVIDDDFDFLDRNEDVGYDAFAYSGGGIASGPYYLFVEVELVSGPPDVNPTNNVSAGAPIIITNPQDSLPTDPGNSEAPTAPTTPTANPSTPTSDPSSNEKTGGSGNDALDGTGPSYRLVGGAGDDVYTVDDVGDVVVEIAGGGIDQINATISVDLRGSGLSHVEKLDLSGSSNIDGHGNALDNWIYGNDYNNRLNGERGDDELGGRFGDDQLFDPFGDDTMYGAFGNDVLIDFQGKNALWGDEDSDLIIGGSNADFIGGGRDSDVLIGDLTANFFGNDTLSGGSGDDLLQGGGGHDTFAFTPNDGNDVIGQISIDYANPGASFIVGADFVLGVDEIRFGGGFGYNTDQDAKSNFSETSDSLRFSDQGTTFDIIGLSLSDLQALDIDIV